MKQNNRPHTHGAASVPKPALSKAKSKTASITHKLGVNQKETAVRAVPLDANFKQSRDIREDRGIRQSKTAGPGGAGHGK
jgi:hypothetical protein